MKKEISNYEEDRLSSRFAALYDTIKQMKKIEMWNYVKDIGLIILMIILSISMIGVTIYLYWLADTKDMYIYD